MRLTLSASIRHIVTLPALLGALAAVTVSAEEITIKRDDFGVPHIFAETEAGVCYGMGYAQAEDRLEELLKQYRRATGTMSEAFGPQFFRDDWRQRLWRHAQVAKEKYHTLSEKSRSMNEAYLAGVKKYMQEHPGKVPAWAPPLEPWMTVALARYIIWGWPEGDAGGDMLRGGIEPDPVGYRGSNQWLLAPEKTAYDAPIALIDPHLGWYGAFRFYEARLYGGDLQLSGMAIVGLPIPSLGHSRYCSVAMTTGGPDAADCYEIELNPDNPLQYKYDGQWRDITVRTEPIRVKTKKGVRSKEMEFQSTHHGPIVARKDGKAYVLKLPYADEVSLADQTYKMVTARNLKEMKAALGMLQLMEQNVMVATVDGDIFYLRNARIPVRAPGFDYKRPLPGNTSKSEWKGIHPITDLVQLENPPQGYMQNCNVSPQFMLVDSPLQPQKWADRPYLFNGFGGMDKRYDNPLHQRAAMTLQTLHAAKNVTVEDAIEIAFQTDVYGADVWQKMLNKAWRTADETVTSDKNVSSMYDVITKWNRNCDAESVGAVAYYYWKKQFDGDVILHDRAGFPPPETVTDAQIIECLQKGAAELKRDHERVDIPYGDVYRVGRRGTGKTWPVSGGSTNTIATPRAIGFSEIGDTKKYLARGGQTSTQIVLLTKPPQSWTVLPLGESDDPNSPHYDDQAEKLFSKGKMKPTYFLNPEELDKHVTRTVKLQYR